MHGITIKKSAAKELESLPGKFIRNITEKIYLLANDPPPRREQKITRRIRKSMENSNGRLSYHLCDRGYNKNY